ncbi:MAG: M23 family metallopeptidase [Nitrospira sp.]|nr:M23 family metallopeptidase [Nitrospira sp.]MDD9860624.1 M23 family metallopeptidase [Nitrospira sp.]
MKLADDVYTIVIFRGARANPLRIDLSRRMVRGGMVAIAVLVVVQIWSLTHYVTHMEQGDELTALRQEMSQSRSHMFAVSDTIADIKQRMVATQELSQKLQAMFGLESEPVQSTGNSGQGGEETPQEEALDGDPAQQMGEVGSGNAAGPSVMPTHRQPSQVAAIQKELAWLDLQTLRQQRMFDQLEEVAGQRFDRWDSTPSIWPVKGSITSKFGPRISPFTGKKAFHSGVDIGARKRTKVLAPAKGEVVMAAYNWRMGNFIRLGHGYGIETIYGHLDESLVERGQKVKRGEVIGLVGSTGKFSTGPHLHYQVVVNDKIVDPLQYILD